MTKQATLKTKILGWAMCMNKWRDETGVFHLVVTQGDNVARPACGRAKRLGGIEFNRESQINRGQSCAVCRRIELRLAPLSVAEILTAAIGYPPISAD